MEVPGTETLARFREKLDRELKSGLVSLLLLLVVERTGPAYGYRILANLKEASGGHLAFKEGTAYPLLNNLEKIGFVTSYWGSGSGGPPRKYYQATALGRCALDQALEDWFGLIGNVDRIIRRLTSTSPESPREAAPRDGPGAPSQPEAAPAAGSGPQATAPSPDLSALTDPNPATTPKESNP